MTHAFFLEISHLSRDHAPQPRRPVSLQDVTALRAQTSVSAWPSLEHLLGSLENPNAAQAALSLPDMPQTRQRKGRENRGVETSKADLQAISPLDSITDPRSANPDMTASSSVLGALRRQPVWIVLAVSSGTCAAFNGVFAKL